MIDYSLYVITTDLSSSMENHLEIARDALCGGATVIQFREKEAGTRELLYLARQIKKVAEAAKVPLIVNDRVDIGLAVDAEGVHIGQGDIPIEVARRLLGKDRIIGVTATSLEEAVEAERRGADYLGVSPVFATPSKDDAGEPMGLKKLGEIRRAVRIPIVAIGGITRENLEGVINAGADGIAVISAIAAASDRKQATADLLGRIEKCKAKRKSMR